MQVRADDALVDEALKAIVAVVAGARDDGRSEWRGLCIEQGAAAVVLKSHKGLGCQIGFDGYVADQAVGAAYGFGGNDPQTLNAILTHIVRTAEQLIAAADGEQRTAILNIGCDLVFLSEQFMCDRQLVAVGATAHHDDIGVGEIERLAHTDLVHAHGNAAPSAAALERDNIAAVAIEVKGIGIQVDDAQRARKLDWRDADRKSAAVGTGYGAGSNSVGSGALQSVEFLDQRREGRVVGDGVEGVIGGFIHNGANCLRDVRDNRGIDAGVLEAYLHVVRTRASGKGDKSWGIGDALKVDVVDPRYIVSVGVVVVEEESAESAACRLDGLDLSIEAYGILSQVGLDGAAGDIPAAHASAGGDVGIERGLQVRGIHA